MAKKKKVNLVQHGMKDQNPKKDQEDIKKRLNKIEKRMYKKYNRQGR